MSETYRVKDVSSVITPALLVFEDILRANLDRMIQIAGDASRLRPHCKTHKIREIAALELELGITKHKCATFAEAEMLASAGVKDIFLAYNPVGPNIDRAIKYKQKFPDVQLSVTCDHPKPLAALATAASSAGVEIDVLLDLDIGMGRTGIQPGPRAKELYGTVAGADGLRAGGLHAYDGHNHQTPLDERQAAVEDVWSKTVTFRDELVAAGLSVPRIVAAGTGTFPIFAQKEDPTLELSPGTTVFHDVGYGRMFPDMDFTPAAVLLTRVISCPSGNRITLDLGYKACASDPPAGDRLAFPDLPDAREVLQNEEHLVIETKEASRFEPGDELLAIPRHICPTTAMHKQVFVIKDGKHVETWNVVARDRQLSI